MHYKIELLRKMKEHLNRGGIIAYATESCFGLGCDPFNYKAIKKLLNLKQRSSEKGLIVIGHSFKSLNKLIKPITKIDENQLKKYWPGAFSIILPVQEKIVHKILVGKYNSLAVRISKHKLAFKLCKYLDNPIVSTSANRSKISPAKTYRECKRRFGNKVLVLPGNTSFMKRPSTIINWQTKKLLR